MRGITSSRFFYVSRYNKELQFSFLPQRGRAEPLTEGEVAADRRGSMPPQAIMMLSTI